jgi:hypothetical protein
MIDQNPRMNKREKKGWELNEKMKREKKGHYQAKMIFIGNSPMASPQIGLGPKPPSRQPFIFLREKTPRHTRHRV